MYALSLSFAVNVISAVDYPSRLFHNTYEVLIDLKSVQKGSLLEDWDMIPPKTIKDPKASKPSDWDENEEIDDPEDKKPDGYDDIPKQITDPDAKKPDDWDDESDGEGNLHLVTILLAGFREAHCVLCDSDRRLDTNLR